MPVFGKSLFETVLAGLSDPIPDDEEEPASEPVRGFNAGFVGRAWTAKPETELDPSSLYDGYPPEPAPVKPNIPTWIGRISDAEIAEDLGLSTCRSASDLRERRRLFALDNHPDRVTDDYRTQATRRMMLANQLIDAALTKLR